MTAPKGRIVILESPDPMDLLQGRSEAQTLAAACKLIGYETASFTIRSKTEFDKTCEYISTITEDHDATESNDIPLFIHISCHGNKSGLAFGTDPVTWKQLAKSISPLCNMENYSGGFVLSISACGAGGQTITSKLSTAFKTDGAITPPHYLFVTAGDEVAWDDAAVSWVNLYHKLGDMNLAHRFSLQKSLDAITELTGAQLSYYRWAEDESKFRRYATNAT